MQILNNSSFELRERQRKAIAEIRKVHAELEKVEKDIRSLQKLFTDANRKKDEAYNTILRLKKQYGEEVYMIIGHLGTLTLSPDLYLFTEYVRK